MSNKATNTPLNVQDIEQFTEHEQRKEMNANELADWIKDTEFYDNPNPELNDKMDEVEAILRQQQAEIEALKADKEHLIENYENLMADFKIETYWRNGK